MPRCLMAKKWKAYAWPTTTDAEEKCRIQVKSTCKSDSEDEEEIDVVTIHNGSSGRQQESAVHQDASGQRNIYSPQHQSPGCSAIQYQTTSSPQPLVIDHRQSSQILVTPIHPPPQSYYRASPEDYIGASSATSASSSSDHVKPIASPPVILTHHNLPTVIQQHHSPPQQQVRHTSVIHHSSSILNSQNDDCANDQNASVSSSSSINHSASPMQPPSSWAPSSPTEGTTAPSPPLHIQHSSQSETKTNPYGYVPDAGHYSTLTGKENCSSTSPTYNSTSQPHQQTTAEPSRPQPTRTRSLAMCFTSTGAALSLPPKKKDIYRPYSLDDRPPVRWRPPEDLSAAHAILDLSASPPVQSTPPSPAPKSVSPRPRTPTPPPQAIVNVKPQTKTIAYTYEAFFVSDGRSKKRTVTSDVMLTSEQRPKYTCSECGKQYATSSNLSRHKQTHRSLDSQSAKKCLTCGKAYVSMPALAMHLLTHKLNHACGICGKLFSRPWLLQGHLRSHTGEKPYGCAHCGKAFADRSNLRAHMQTHSADKNFECVRCHKTFALKSYLNKHLESACIGEPECNNNVTAPINQLSNSIIHLQ